MLCHLDYGRTGLAVELPDRHVVGCLGLAPAEPLAEPAAAVARSLARPIGTPPLAELVQRVLAVARGETSPVIRSDVVEMSRDLIHVRDAVRALDGLLQQGASGVVYNVCSGTGRSLGAVVRALVHAAGVTASLEPVENPDPMLSSLWSGDVRRLRDTLGWVPAPMGEDGIRDLLAGR